MNRASTRARLTRRLPVRVVEHRQVVIDVASGLLIFAGLLLSTASSPISSTPTRFGLAVLYGITMSLRNRLPLLSFLLASVPFFFFAGETSKTFGNLPLLLTAYSLAARGAIASWIIGVVTAVVLSTELWADPPSSPGQAAGSVILNVLLGFVPIGLANVQRRYRHLSVELAWRNEELERLKGIEVTQAVLAERNRIARDLHDVVAHHISAVSLRATGAAHVMGTEDSDSMVREALAFIRSSSTDALTAMRAMVGALRADGESPPLGSSQPSIAEIDTLIDQSRLLGLTVHRNTSGDLGALSPTIQMCAYRLVQESLTNVAKHADAGVVEVELLAEADNLRVSVTDDGRSQHLNGDRPEGFGIAGMRERVEFLGGLLTAGPAVGIGWRVAALIPLGSHV